MKSSAVLRFVALLATGTSATACFDPTEQPSEGTDASAESTTSASAGDTSDPSGGSDPTASTTATTTSQSTTDPSGDSSADDDTSGSDDSATGPGSTTEDATSTSAPGSSEGPATCDGQCAPEVPAGWQGPVVVYDGTDDAPPCPGEFPQVVHADGHAGLDAGSAVCDCDCGDVVGASCGAATLREEGNLCIAFVQNPDLYVLQPNACTQINAPANTYSLTAPPLQTAGASCSPQAIEEIATPSWDRHVRSCTTDAGDACDDGACFPAVPADFAMCVWVEGEAACPAGPWAQTIVSYADVTDDRDCTACTCDAPTGVCGGAADLTNFGCGGGVVLVDSIVAGGCANVDSASHATWTPEVDASCAPSGGSLTGEVTATGAVTYCCL